MWDVFRFRTSVIARRGSLGALLFWGVFMLSAAPAHAATISLNLSHTAVAGSPSFYTLEQIFSLPAGFLNASLTIQSLACDDRCVLQLNGTTITNAGIFGPGAGSMTLTSGGANIPFAFTFGNGAQNLLVNSGFLTGSNTLLLIVNDTNQGIFGAPLPGGVNISGVGFSGSVNFDSPTTAVPEPGSTLALLGISALGILAGRRRMLHR